ncbi:DUF4328 domain-containing protein [Halobacillus litoralis]|uniref:DUF4328 domain-containing protein n=1 Tax=Halobacillus litoralis TaxID=45668 RepID=UPI001CD3304B|nr:DUF4328 domain-containing protein [Halobacillus litoralis]MCA0970880.1 DUF4328 domain-containing protein [Halobacillus litoralis]
MKLQSKEPEKPMQILLLIDIGLTVLLMIDVVLLNFIEPGDGFATYENIVGLVLTLTVLAYTILFLGWIYRVHKDLQSLDRSYPTSPGGALARVLIPIFNLYGLWNVYSAMANFFKKEPFTSEAGKNLGKVIPFYYALFLITTFVNDYIIRNFVNSIVLFLSYIGDIALVVTYILIIKFVSRGLSNLVEHQAEVQGDENEAQ